MSAFNHAARAGAAAFLLGLSLSATPAIAYADDTDTDSGSGRPTAGAAADAQGVQRPSRGAVAGVRRGGAGRSVAPAPAAARVSAPDAAAAAKDDSAIPSQLPARHSRRGPAALGASGTAADDDAAAVAVNSAADSGEPAAVPAAPAVLPGSTASATSTASSTVEPAPLPARPGAVAALTAATGPVAAASVFDMFNGVLAPIQNLIDGVLLLVRRTFFNQAPTVTPVQLTGQSTGPITGTVGAVDPEGDPMVYSITQTPLHGSAVVNADGTFSYTPGAGFNGTDTFIVEAVDTGFHINLLDWFRPAGTSGDVTVNQGVLPPRVQFQFAYGSGSQYWSSAARSALESVATALSSYLVVNAPVTVTYAVSGEFNPLSGTLASAGSDLISSDAGFLPTVVQNKILAGADSNGAAADGTITWNFGQGWALSDPVGYSQYDFQSTALHELLHTLGFMSNAGAPGTNTGTNWLVYDKYVVTSNGTSVIGNDFTWNPAYDANLTGGKGGLFFGGANAVDAYGGVVPLYTPNPWNPGSSMSHLDDDTFTGANNKLMNADTDKGPGIRVISPVELGILKDIGYTIG